VAALRRLDRTALGVLFRNELRMLVRDRRTILMAVVLPLAFMPVALFASYWATRKRETALEERTYRYAVTGPRADAARRQIATAAARRDGGPGAAGSGFKAIEVEAADPGGDLQRGRIDFYVEARGPGEAAAAGRPDGGVGGGEAVPSIRLAFRGDRDDSRAGFEAMRTLLLEARRDERYALLRARGSPLDPADVVPLAEVDAAGAGRVAGLALGRIATLFVVLFMLSGGATVATDAIAGEKERGTLETLLSTAVRRIDVVAAKQLAIFTVALLVTAIQVANLLAYVGFGLVPAPAGLSAAVPPRIAALLLLLYLPVAALVSSVLLLTSGHARTHKEAQLYFLPVMLAGAAPSLAPLLPGLALRSAIAVVPVAGVAVAVKEVLIGRFDWPFIALAWAATAGAAVYAAARTLRALSTERLIMAMAGDTDLADLRGGPELFPRRVLRWFALMWVANLLSAGALAGVGDIRVAIAVSVVGILLGGSLLMIRTYRLDVRRALALRPVRPSAWVAVAVGAPAGVLAASGVQKLASLVLPVSDEVLEAFGRALSPGAIPVWEQIVFFAVLPAVCEEVAFRGLLLHGLRRRLRPAALALAVGAVFALFHGALFRLGPTFFLGVVLAATTLLTGSILPAIVWHASHNGLTLAAAGAGLPLDGLGPGLYAAGAAGLAAAFWILWRTRTPYPGLREAEPGRRGDPGG
jgi:sodium transport system permease protein